MCNLLTEHLDVTVFTIILIFSWLLVVTIGIFVLIDHKIDPPSKRPQNQPGYWSGRPYDPYD